MSRVVPSLRLTATLGFLLLAGAVGMTWWMSNRPRVQDRSIEAAVAARQHQPVTSRPEATPSPHVVTQASGAAPAAGSAPVQLAPVHAPSPAYPMEALRQERGGVVTLRVSVNGQGEVVHVAVARSSGDPALDASARTTLREWTFQAPASHQPVTFDYNVRFHIATPS